jgi:predicted transcriptional regulator
MRINDAGWETTRERLREVVKMRGADSVAAEIPVARSTVFRLLNGDIQPRSITVDAIERVLEERDLKTARQFE